MTVRQGFYIAVPASLVLTVLIGIAWPPFLWVLLVLVPLILVGAWDATHGIHNVLRNYPVIGHVRYMAEFIRPEIQQYFIASNLGGRPFPRETRDVVTSRADLGKEGGIMAFGTQHDLMTVNEDLGYHSIAPTTVPEEAMRVTVGGPDCTKPYSASRLNVSAMSFGALSSNAILALNKGAALGNFAQDTGEGGLSDHHLAGGGDIIWQIGTGYFGCRTRDGEFDPEEFRRKAAHDKVRMIEIKISQGAKPSHGGVLPAAKITPEIARIRGVPMGQDCISPPGHKEFSTPRELLDFVTRLRTLSDGKPVGFKLCVGRKSEFLGICKAMAEIGVTPDFITVDGAEGGTGAAPIEFTNRLGMPINEALPFVHNALVGVGLRDRIRVAASGKVATGFDLAAKLALGADWCNAARAMMFTVGCIQALHCHTNKCPTGVATQDPRRAYALDVETKHRRTARYHGATVEACRDIIGAMGVDHPDRLRPSMILRRNADGLAVPYDELYPYVETGALLRDEIPDSLARDWAASSADRF